mmetsp:Transcript_16680/g.31928  ORF Transcript_16680/g.31928 Transcript_16680/m.31928 type:complete len:290 (-) Transcript_16680:677-1546(-)
MCGALHSSLPKAHATLASVLMGMAWMLSTTSLAMLFISLGWRYSQLAYAQTVAWMLRASKWLCLSSMRWHTSEANALSNALTHPGRLEPSWLPTAHSRLAISCPRNWAARGVAASLTSSISPEPPCPSLLCAHAMFPRACVSNSSMQSCKSLAKRRVRASCRHLARSRESSSSSFLASLWKVVQRFTALYSWPAALYSCRISSGLSAFAMRELRCLASSLAGSGTSSFISSRTPSVVTTGFHAGLVSNRESSSLSFCMSLSSPLSSSTAFSGDDVAEAHVTTETNPLFW